MAMRLKHGNPHALDLLVGKEIHSIEPVDDKNLLVVTTKDGYRVEFQVSGNGKPSLKVKNRDNSVLFME